MTNSEDIHQVSDQLVSLNIVDGKKYDYQSLFDNLAAKINHLINTDFSALVQLLYTLDISELKLKSILANTNANAAQLIATLIIERQLEKIESRRAFKKQEDIPENERW